MTRNVKIKVILLFWLGDVPKAKMAAPELRRFPPELLLFRFKNIFLSFFFRIRILKNELKSIGFAEIWSSRTLGKIVTKKKRKQEGVGTTGKIETDNKSLPREEECWKRRNGWLEFAVLL